MDTSWPPDAATGDPILKHFNYTDLLDDTDVKLTKLMAETALGAIVYCPRGLERSAGLRKLMEALDCFRRAAK